VRITGDSYLGRTIRLVWEAERCESLRDVKWVDDETNLYCRYETPFRVVNNYGGTTTYIATYIVSARKILIDLDALVIIINPVPDQESNAGENEKEKANAVATQS
jgi:hypothetical protein